MQQSKKSLYQNDNIAQESQEQSGLLKSLRQKVKELLAVFEQKRIKKSNITKSLKEILERKQFFLKQKVVQQNKYKSLNLLVTELQCRYQKQMLQVKSRQFLVHEDQSSNFALQNHLLRQQLMKVNQSCKQDQKIYCFLKQLDVNKNNLMSFVSRSNYIQGQSQTLVQIRSHLRTLENPNLQCRRKWMALSKQKQKNEDDLRIYKIQTQRQAQLLKSLYEQYLQKINASKAKIVNFNETQRQKLLTEYLVHQVALVQHKRRQVEDENRNLHFHNQQLSQQWQKVQLENKQLGSFFMNQNRTQQSKLAMKMKTRIEQLKDILAQVENRNSVTSVFNRKNSNLEYVGTKLQKAKQANDFMQIKQKDIDEGRFNHFDEKQISQFFTSILNSKDQKCQIIKQRAQSMNSQLRQLTMKQLLLQSQVSNIEEILRENSIQTQQIKRQFMNKKTV